MQKLINKLLSLAKSPEFQKFAVIGITSFIVDTGILYTEVNILKISIYIFSIIFLPNLISTSIAIVYNFTLQKTWAFKSKNEKTSKEFGKFVGVSVFNLIIFSGIIFGIIANFGVHLLVDKVLVTLLQMSVSYLMYKNFVFKKKLTPTESLEETIANID